MKSRILLPTILATLMFSSCADNETTPVDPNNGTSNNEMSNNEMSNNGMSNNGTTNNNGTNNNGTNNNNSNTNNGTTTPQTTFAQVQVIHNSADPAAAVVDIYINDVLTLDNFEFRTATPFVSVPSGIDVNIAVAGENSTGVADAIATFGPYNLATDSATILVASGVLTPDTFGANPDGNSTAFDLYPIVDAEVEAQGKNRFAFFHGATDVPTVDIIAAGTLAVDGASYGNSSAYFDLPNGIVAFDVHLDVNDMYVGSFQTPDLSNLGGVFIPSGFDDQTQNPSAPVGLYVFPSTGGEGILLKEAARLQIIHNAADPLLAKVDVYMNENLAIDDFAFRTATPFITVPSGVEIPIVIAPDNSTSIANALTTIPITLDENSTNQAIVDGVIIETDFAANPDSVPTGFDLILSDNAQESSTDPQEFQLRIFHGAADAPTVDIGATDISQLSRVGITPLFEDAKYKDLSDYIGVNPSEYGITVQTSDTADRVRYDIADLSDLAGEAGIILASGFLEPEFNKDGESLKLVFFTNLGGEGVILTSGLQ